jgi:murein DD-endopeptidase MepM/ murein hydrolase activator NlpD
VFVVRRIGRGTAAVVVAGALALATAGGLGAQTAEQDRIDDQIKSLREHVTEASAEEGRLLGLIDESSARKRELDAKVGAFDRQIAGVQRELDAAESRLDALAAQQRGTEVRLGEATAELEAAKAELVRQAIAAYTGRSEAARYASMLFESSTMSELASKRSYIKAVVGTQSEAIAADERLRDEVDDLRKELERSKAEAASQRNVIQDQQVRLQQSRDAQDTVRQEAAAELSQRNGLRDQVLARKVDFEAQVAELERESAAIAEDLRRRQAEAARRAEAERAVTPGGSGSSPGSGSGGTGGSGDSDAPAARPAAGKLLNPVPGAPITSGFGPRVHPIYGDARLHTGVDIGAGSGTSIRAAGDGVVITAGTMSGYGNTTIIDHGGGMATLYAHQSSIGVSEGQRVSAGQSIGRVGCTGSCTGPHLHFEVRIDGDPVNPVPYMS